MVYTAPRNYLLQVAVEIRVTSVVRGTRKVWCDFAIKFCAMLALLLKDAVPHKPPTLLCEYANQLQPALFNLQEVTSEKSCDEGFMNEDCPPSSTAFLSAKLSNLEVENERLKCANEDLNVRLARNITDARALMGSSSENSIATEMLSATRDEVVETLRRKEAENIQLRAYLDKIILSVLEKDPSILEIK